MKKSKQLLLLILLCVVNVASANCLFNVNNLDFGNYHSPYQRTDLLSSSPIGVMCDSLSSGNTLTIKMYPGQSSNYNRYLSNGKDNLYYNLFLDSSRSIIWGDGSNGTSTYNASITQNTNIMIFSSVFKNQNISPGIYQDSIVFEMNF